MVPALGRLTVDQDGSILHLDGDGRANDIAVRTSKVRSICQRLGGCLFREEQSAEMWEREGGEFRRMETQMTMDWFCKDVCLGEG